MKPFCSVRLRLATAITATLMAGSAEAGTVRVLNTNNALAGSLRQAVQDASAGDKIIFQIPTTDPGYNAATNVFTITLTTDELAIAKDLTIDSGGQKIVVTRSIAFSTPDFRIFNVTSGTVTIAQLTIMNGAASGASASGGGGIRNAGTLTLRACTLRNNSAGTFPGGGGLYNAAGGTAAISNCTFTANVYDAIENAANGTIMLNNSTVFGNGGSAPGAGGIYNAGIARIRNTIIANNEGSLLDATGTFVSEGYNFIGQRDQSTGFTNTGDQTGTNAAPADPRLGAFQDNGGPTPTFAPVAGSPVIDQGNRGKDNTNQLINTDQRGDPRPVDQSAIANAVSGDGSDIGAVELALLQPGPTFIVTNTAEHDDGNCTMDDCTLLEGINAANANADTSTINFVPGLTGTILNTVAPGGLEITNSLTINGPGARLLTISGNNVSRVFNVSPGAIVSFRGLTIAHGNSSGIGGGIYNDHGAVTLTDCTVSGNTGYSGGGIFSRGSTSGSASLTLIRSTISANVANGGLGEGGGLFNEGVNGGAATLTLTNCTISGNTSPAIPSAAGLESFGRDGSATVTLSNCTLNSNAIANDNASLSAANTIFNAGTGGATITNSSGTLMSRGHNLSSDAAGGFLTGAGDKPNTNPMLVTLKNNGGTTDTLALLSGSPAINAGDDTKAATTDQRGYLRSGISDIGAFEFGGTPAPAPAAQLSNVSTRVRVLTGDKVLIGGFIVTGSAPKKVIIRAIGPSLTSFGVTGALADPILELHKPGNIVVTNDNWKTTQQAAIQATGIAPKNDLESAIVATLAPGNYTAIVRGKNNGIGVGLVEAYDLDQAAASQLGNISTRGFVDTGENVMIGGIIVGPAGAPSGKMLIRAIGPSLASSGIAGPLADPTLELHNGNGVLTASNDNWKTSQQTVIQATGIPPTNDKESAILATLAPGNYTAIVRGKNNTTGVALVEVYNVP